MEVLHVYLYSLDNTSFCMLAISLAGAGFISNRLDSDASIPHYWSHDEWAICVPLSTDYAASQNSKRTGSKVKKYFEFCSSTRCNPFISSLFN